MSRIVPKDEVRYVFNPYVLLPGDILLMNTYEDRLREKMQCKYEHAAIYIGDAFIMEANGAHVVMEHIYSYAFREQEHACVLRLKMFSHVIGKAVALHSREQMGRDYVNTNQFRYVRAFKNTPDKKDATNCSFCSRLVAQSYEQENIHLVTNADFCEPDDFLASPLLIPVPDSVVPYTTVIEDVVMSKQQSRVANEIDSPNAELFHSLSCLLGENIQDLTQAILAVRKQPDLTQEAIDRVKSSRMFKHKADVDRDMPWLWDDVAFLAHYEDSDSAMHFLYSQMNHYDRTIIPNYKQLYLQLVGIANYNSECQFVVFLRDYIKDMVDEAILCRKRMEALYELMMHSRQDEFNDFTSRYGSYLGYRYVDRPIDIGFLLREILKSSDNQ